MIQVSVDDADVDRGPLTQSLGGMPTHEDVEPHVAVESLYGRRVLLASDGLFGHVDVAELQEAMVDDDESSVQRLLTVALERGGPDNVTIALVRRVEEVTVGGR